MPEQDRQEGNLPFTVGALETEFKPIDRFRLQTNQELKRDQKVILKYMRMHLEHLPPTAHRHSKKLLRSCRTIYNRLRRCGKKDDLNLWKELRLKVQNNEEILMDESQPMNETTKKFWDKNKTKSQFLKKSLIRKMLKPTSISESLRSDERFWVDLMTLLPARVRVGIGRNYT